MAPYDYEFSALSGISSDSEVKKVSKKRHRSEPQSLLSSCLGRPAKTISFDADTELSLRPPRIATEPRTEPPSLSDLGDDLLLQILQMAHPTAWDLCRLACVNRTWRKMCYNKVFWTKLRIGPGSMRPGVEQLAPRCATLVELHVDDPRCELHVLHPLIMACANTLRRVVIDCDRDNTSRNEASISSVLWLISLYCKRVESVELLSNGQEGSFSFLEGKTMWYLTSGFRHMRSFACLGLNSVTKQSIYLMVIAWRELACLRVHCGGLAQDDLLALRKCYSLRMLELVGGDLRKLVGTDNPEYDGEVIHRDLEVAVLTRMSADEDDIARLCAMCPRLASVVVRQAPRSMGAERQARLRQWLAAHRNVQIHFEA